MPGDDDPTNNSADIPPKSSNVQDVAMNQAMLDSMGEGAIGVNDKGEVIFVNHRVEVMTGYLQNELIGKFLLHALKVVDDKGVDVPMEERPVRMAVYSKVRAVKRDYSIVRKDGTKFSAAITATPVILSDVVIGGIVVIEDITREKQIDKMKNEFISLASHQLRTPLSAMKWYCEVLIDGDVGQLTPQQTDVVQKLHYSNERMIELVNSLLNISRIESGRMIIEPTPTDMVELVKRVSEEVKPSLLEKQQKLKFDFSNNLPNINIDPKLTRHVYMNLLTNAIKYTPVGGEIKLSISTKDENMLSSVEDTGYGIPEDQKMHVFEKFFRSPNIKQIVADGTGLGLYLAKSIVENQGGKMWFDSQEQKGSIFWFSLPLAGAAPVKGEVEIS